MSNQPTTIQTVHSLCSSQLELCTKINKEARTSGRVFITDKENSSAHVYVKSNTMFVENIDANVIVCRCIDDGSKSMLDEIDFHVLNNFNQKREVFMDTEAVAALNLRDFIKFTRENGSYLRLIITDQLKILDVDNKTKLSPIDLKHKMIKVIFSPLCVDVDKNTNQFAVKYYGFTIQVANEAPPPYILLELVEEGVEYVGLRDDEQEKKKKSMMEINKPIDFGENPFNT